MVRIVQLSDLHLTSAPDGRTWRADVWGNLRRALEHVRSELGTVDLLVLTGDLANQRRPETYARLRDAVSGWADRLRVLPGNHDNREMVRAAFGDRLLPGAASLNFVQELGAFRLIGLDTLRPLRVHGRLGEEQLAWLTKELGQSNTPAIFFMHHPPICVGTWWLDKDLLRDHQAFRSVVQGAPVRAIFTGHVHQDSTGRFADAQVFTTPSTAYQFRPRSLMPASSVQGPPAFRVIDLEGARIDTHVVRL
jgi:3',5'-cyclic AMP phosphodiesterase CpdA